NALLERAGVEEGQPITLEQAKAITQLLSQEVLQSERATEDDNALAYYGRPYGSAAAVVILGVLVMSWVNGWPKIDSSRRAGVRRILGYGFTKATESFQNVLMLRTWGRLQQEHKASSSS
ncbi:hypothetical protein KC352_g36786, partial [Hortaea werneckii]